MRGSHKNCSRYSLLEGNPPIPDRLTTARTTPLLLTPALVRLTQRSLESNAAGGRRRLWQRLEVANGNHLISPSLLNSVTHANRFVTAAVAEQRRICRQMEASYGRSSGLRQMRARSHGARLTDSTLVYMYVQLLVPRGHGHTR